MIAMPRRRFILDSPTRFIPLAVGPPGERVFYLQTVQGRAVVSVALEKVQLQVLADRLGVLLDEVRRRGMDPAADEIAGEGVDDDRPAEQPLVPIFRVGAMVLAWDGEKNEVVVETREQTDDGDEDDDASADADADSDDGPDLVRVSIPSSMARAFIRRASRLVAAGRPPCPLCGLPMDPTGHICPRRGATYLN